MRPKQRPDFDLTTGSRSARIGQVSEWTNGRFDVTFGALSGLWKFDDQDKDKTIPGRAEVLAHLPLVNYRNLVVNEREGTAFLTRKGMRAHLGGNVSAANLGA